MPYIQPNVVKPVAKSDKVAKPKNVSSSISRTIPGTGTLASPDRLGSSGTAKVPHNTAARKGIPRASKNLRIPSL